MSKNEKVLARDISRCYEMGYHSHMAGPCFRTEAEAVAFRDRCEFYEATHSGSWRDTPHLPTPPASWVNPLDEVLA